MEIKLVDTHGFAIIYRFVHILHKALKKLECAQNISVVVIYNIKAT